MSFTEKFNFTVALPFEEGKTYNTKFQTGCKFTITKIIYSKKDGKVAHMYGFYDDKNDAICPLNPDRLIPLTESKNNIRGVVGNAINEHYKNINDFANLIKGSYSQEEIEIIAEDIKKLFL